MRVKDSPHASMEPLTRMGCFASFAVMIAGTSFLPLSIVPLIVNTAVTFSEVVVALLQAYVFTILSCIYLNDALNLH